MSWTPITSPSQLVGAHEHSSFDAKRSYSNADPDARKEEMCKDIAAFATAMGGTLVVGAAEQGGRIVALPGVENVRRLQEDISKAVQSLCFPTPSFADRVVAINANWRELILGRPGASEPDVDLLVLNIYPMPAGPVAVRAVRDRDLYRFPIRVGDQTEFLDPARLSLYMNTHDRQIALLLHEILQDDALPTVRFPDAQDSKGAVVPGERGRHVEVFDRRRLEGSAACTRILKRLDERHMVAVFDAGHLGEGEVEAHVPLTFVRAVWNDPREGWSIALEGSLFRPLTTSKRVIPFIPPGI